MRLAASALTASIVALVAALSYIATGTGGADAAAEHRLHPRRRSRRQRPRCLRPQGAPHAAPRSARGGGPALHDGVCRLADLLAVARGAHDRPGAGAAASDDLHPRPARYAVTEAPASADAAAAAARGDDAGRAAARGRLRHRDDWQVAPRRRGIHAARSGIRRRACRPGDDQAERDRRRQGRVRPDERGGALHRREPRAPVLPLPRPQQPAHPVPVGEAGAGDRQCRRLRTRVCRDAADARRQRRPPARPSRRHRPARAHGRHLHQRQRRPARAGRAAPARDAQHAVPRRQGLPLRRRPARAAHRPRPGHPGGTRRRRAGDEHRLAADAPRSGGRARRAESRRRQPDEPAAHGQAGVSERGRSSGTSRTTPIREAGRRGPFGMAAGSWSNTTTAARWSCSISTPT